MVVVVVTLVVVVVVDCVCPGARVVVVVVGPAAVGAVVGCGAGFKTRAAAETGGRATRAATGVFRLASNRPGNATLMEEDAGNGLGAEFVVDGAAAENVVGGDAVAPFDLLGAPFDGSVSF